METNYYKSFLELSDVQLLNAIYKYHGYSEEAKPFLKKVAIERKFIDEDFNYLVENFDEELKDFYESVICTVHSQNLLGYVPLKIRFYHLLVDYVGVYLFFHFSWILLSFLGYSEFLLQFPEKIFGLIFCFGYFFFMELMYDKTLGKFLTKTRVVNYQKQKPTTSQIFIRSMCRFIPFEQFSFFGERPVGFHDSISRTYVVFD
jgi:uncharacterized RDD family membrane protein YckC